MWIVQGRNSLVDLMPLWQNASLREYSIAALRYDLSYAAAAAQAVCSRSICGSWVSWINSGNLLFPFGVEHCGQGHREVRLQLRYGRFCSRT
jgi:hypothetical protein